jgi:hypothetical protein
MIIFFNSIKFHIVAFLCDIILISFSSEICFSFLVAVSIYQMLYAKTIQDGIIPFFSYISYIFLLDKISFFTITFFLFLLLFFILCNVYVFRSIIRDILLFAICYIITLKYVINIETINIFFLTCILINISLSHKKNAMYE